jgi:hypothetical protein
METTGKIFYDKARLLGHDTDALALGEEITTYFRFDTMEDCRRLISMATQEQREKRQEHFYNPPIAARQRLGQGMHDRGEAALFANGTIPDGDRQGIGNHLPGRMKAVSVLKKTLRAGEVWDVSVRGEHWGIDDLEELYVTVNVGELIIEPGASIIIRGNVFSLCCERLTCKAEAPFGAYHIGILPTPFSVDAREGDLDGGNGTDGWDGHNGRDGHPVQVSSSLIGYMLVDDIDPAMMNGIDGTPGTAATAGIDGRNGGMCKIAEISVYDLQGPCTVFSQAGRGGNGGNGGNGGHGGHGGNGTEGYKLVTGVLSSGAGGNGGNGGDAGKGGHAGHGGVASNIYVSVPVHQEEQVTCVAWPSAGGSAGKAGKPGSGGKGGDGGNGFTKGIMGQDGKNGAEAKDGKEGRDRPAPWIFLNEKAMTGVTAAELQS